MLEVYHYAVAGSGRMKRVWLVRPATISWVRGNTQLYPTVNLIALWVSMSVQKERQSNLDHLHARLSGYKALLSWIQRPTVRKDKSKAKILNLAHTNLLDRLIAF